MRYVIIGNGAAGNAAAAALAAKDPAGEVLIFSDEPEPAYFRPLITNLLDANLSQDISMQKEAASPAGLELGKAVTGLNAAAHEITLAGGEAISYDRLLLATGAAPILPDIPGLPGPGTQVLRTLADAEALARAAQTARQAIILGAGRVGLKAALALRRRGLGVTLVEQGPYPVPLQFDAVAGEIVGQALEAAGIRLLFGQTVSEVRRANGTLQAAVLAGGLVLEAEMIVAAVGVRARKELAFRAGLVVNQGILVDRHLRTSDPDIYAAGDAAETVDLVTGERIVSGLWTNAVEMGRIAGKNMAGGKAEYPGAWGVLNSLEVAGVPTVAIGLTTPPPGPDYQVRQSRHVNDYRKLVFQGEVLVGALLVGDIDAAGVYTGLIRQKVKLGQMEGELDDPRRGIAAFLNKAASHRAG